MKRLLNLFLATLLAFAPVAQADLRASSGAFGPATITSGTIKGTNVPFVVAQWDVPFIHISSGTIGNNGALTAVTTLGTTYTGGAWCFYPANSIAAGIGAGWFWTVFSSTTAGTIFNSTYTSGVPTAGTQTAFVTTGPGAFTGDTSQRTGPNITITGGSLGANGLLRAVQLLSANNTAGNKTFRILWNAGALTTIVQVVTTNLWASSEVLIGNRGAAGLQHIMTLWTSNVAGAGSNPQYATVDTTADQTVQFSLQKAVATDNAVLEGGIVIQSFAQ